MQLTLKNIGIIKEANITLGGLTVIAGFNDSGKRNIQYYNELKSKKKFADDDGNPLKVTDGRNNC